MGEFEHTHVNRCTSYHHASYSTTGVKQLLQDQLVQDDKDDVKSQVDFYNRQQNPSYWQLLTIFTTWTATSMTCFERDSEILY